MIHLRIMILLSGTMIPFTVWGQYDSAQTKPIRSYQAAFHAGFIFAHSEHVQNTRGARPVGIELAMTWQKNDERTWNLCNCFPQHGLTISYYNFDTPILGHGLITAYTLEPWYRLNTANFASLKSAAGLIYLSNPYHVIDNPANQSYSTSLSAYLFLGFGWWHKISKRCWLAAHLEYQHTSNGGMRVPNKGINWPTASLTLSYNPKARSFTAFSKSVWQKQKVIRWDAGVFGITKREGGKPDGKSDHFPLVGVVFQVTKQVGRINNLSAGIEFNYDGVVGSRMEREGVSGIPLHLGVLGGHEFILGKFLFSQRLGMYLYQAANYFDLLYHRWGLTYRVNSHWSIGVNLKAHRQVADYTDVRFIYSF